MMQIDSELNDSKAKAKELLQGISNEYESAIEKIIKFLMESSNFPQHTKGWSIAF